jgi:hypothetical protein
MGEENVGKGCQCIYQYEQHYINLIFNERIEEEKEKLRAVEEYLSSADEHEREMLEGVPDIYKRFISELETVRDRFSTMPSCD